MDLSKSIESFYKNLLYTLSDDDDLDASSDLLITAATLIHEHIYREVEASAQGLDKPHRCNLKRNREASHYRDYFHSSNLTYPENIF
jgi:hypothetical protein